MNIWCDCVKIRACKCRKEQKLIPGSKLSGASNFCATALIVSSRLETCYALLAAAAASFMYPFYYFWALVGACGNTSLHLKVLRLGSRLLKDNQAAAAESLRECFSKKLMTRKFVAKHALFWQSSQIEEATSKNAQPTIIYLVSLLLISFKVSWSRIFIHFLRPSLSELARSIVFKSKRLV